MRSLKMSPTLGDAHVCVRFRKDLAQGIRSSSTHLVKKQLRARVRALAPCKRQNLRGQSIQLNAQQAMASGEHPAAPHLLHRGVLAVRVQRQHAHRAQRVDFAVGFHHRADRVTLPRIAACSSVSVERRGATQTLAAPVR